MRNHYAQSLMVGSTAVMTSAVCARGISFLGALRTVPAHREYNYRLCKHCLDVNITVCEELNDDDPDVS